MNLNTDEYYQQWQQFGGDIDDIKTQMLDEAIKIECQLTEHFNSTEYKYHRHYRLLFVWNTLNKIFETVDKMRAEECLLDAKNAEAEQRLLTQSTAAQVEADHPEPEIQLTESGSALNVILDARQEKLIFDLPREGERDE